MEAERPLMLDMEEKLKDDENGMYRKEVMERLNALDRDLKRRMDAGLAPDEFETAEKLQQAAGAAALVINHMAKRLNNES